MREQNDDALSYTRHDFLCIDTKSVKSNNNDLIHRILEAQSSGRPAPRTDKTKRNMTEDVENWDDWKDYPSFPKVECFTNGEGLELMGYLVHNYARFVCRDSFNNGYAADVEEGSLSWLRTDDMVFIFLTVQHNINKWIRVYKLVKDNLDPDLTKKVDWKALLKQKELKSKVDNLPGTEFCHGSGISGKDAQKRYLSLTKYFNKLYFERARTEMGRPLTDYTDLVQGNRRALLERLQELVRTDDRRNADDDDTSSQVTDELDKNAKRKRRRKRESDDPEHDDILTAEWQAIIGMHRVPKLFSSVSQQANV